MHAIGAMRYSALRTGSLAPERTKSAWKSTTMRNALFFMDGSLWMIGWKGLLSETEIVQLVRAYAEL